MIYNEFDDNSYQRYENEVLRESYFFDNKNYDYYSSKRSFFQILESASDMIYRPIFKEKENSLYDQVYSQEERIKILFRKELNMLKTNKDKKFKQKFINEIYLCAKKIIKEEFSEDEELIYLENFFYDYYFLGLNND